MDWIERLNKAMEYLEEHMTEEISYEKAARIACCSTYHFQRMFAYMANVPLSEYIRRRRMSLAAEDLQSSDEKIVEYVGIAADEPQRIKNIPRKKYPLVERGMTERECLQYCYDHGYNWDEDGIELYSILDRVSCWCCRNKNLKELNNIYKHLPKYWERLRGLQSRIDEPFKGPGKSIFDLEKKFSEYEQITMFL